MTVVDPQRPAKLLSSGDEPGSPPGDRPFRPDVQGLRALAVLLVVGYHAGAPLLTGGFVGVDVFFVISGFVITGLLLRERTATSSTSMLGFYARRARRILPAATLVILATVVASYVWLGFLRGNQIADDGRWASVFLANFHFISTGSSYFGAQQAPSPLLHFWSLSVEEQFYLAFPTLFLIVAARAPTHLLRRALGTVLVIIIGASLAASVLQTASSPLVAYYSPFTRAWELALGGLIAVLGVSLRRIPTWSAAALSWIGVAMVAVAAFRFSDATPYPGSAVLLPVAGAALIIIGGSSAPMFGAEVVLGRWVPRKIGDVSYSLYLWHFPVLVIGTEVLGTTLKVRASLVIVSCVLAVGSYVAIENPMRHAKFLRGSHWRALGVGALLIALSVGISSLLIVSHTSHPGAVVAPPGGAPSTLGELQQKIVAGLKTNSLPSPLAPPLALAASQPWNPPTQPDRCFLSYGGTQAQATSVPVCTLGDPSATRTMVLFGDSQAHMLAGAFDAMASTRHWKLVVLAKDACPPWFSAYPKPGGGAFPACAGFHRFAIHEIRSLGATAVFLAGWTHSAAMDAPGLARLMTTMGQLGVSTGVVGPVPTFARAGHGLDPVDCLAANPSSIQQCTVSLAAARSGFAAVDHAMEAVARRTGAHAIDVSRLFCARGLCPPVVAHRLVSGDTHHVTWVYSNFISGGLGDLVAPVLDAAAGTGR